MEKRRFPRIDFKKPIRFRPKVISLFQGHLAQDLSEGGVRLNSAEFLPIGSTVQIQLQLKEQDHVYDLEGKVVWVRELANMEGFQMGIEFFGGRSYETWKIAQYIYMQQMPEPEPEAYLEEDDRES